MCQIWLGTTLLSVEKGFFAWEPGDMQKPYGTAGDSAAQPGGEGIGKHGARVAVPRAQRKAWRANKVRARAVAKTALVLGCAGVAAVVGVLSSARRPSAPAPHPAHPANVRNPVCRPERPASCDRTWEGVVFGSPGRPHDHIHTVRSTVEGD